MSDYSLPEITEPNALDNHLHRQFDIVVNHDDEFLTDDAVAYILEHLKNPERGGYVHVYAGAVYTRKSEYQAGSVNHDLDKSPYRSNDRHYVIRADIVIPEYMLDDDGTELFERIAISEMTTDKLKKEAARQAALGKAEALRQQAADLEAQAAKLEADLN